MLIVKQRLTLSQRPSEQLVLPFELRQRSRLRAQLASGIEVGLFLERGIVLRGGDLLLAEDGTVIEVVAAPETVSTVRESDPTFLARAGYHLGNRHVPVEIGPGWLRYGHDHVLDDMVRGLGLSVMVEQAAFEPEAGAYGHAHAHAESGVGQSHEHGTASGHSHGPSHDHGHDHGKGHDSHGSGSHGHSPSHSGRGRRHGHN